MIVQLHDGLLLSSAESIKSVEIKTLLLRGLDAVAHSD
jgi:hypothetical protein